MKKTLIEKLSDFLERHFKKIIIGIVIAIIIVPLLIWLCYSILPVKIPTDFSADGMLGFWGTMIGSCISLFVAFVALYQSKKADDATEELEIEKERNRVKPCLCLELHHIRENAFSIKVTNHGNFAAIGVYIFESPLFSVIEAHKSKERKIAFGENKSTVVAIDESWYNLREDGFPKSITLIYIDVNNNVISQAFAFAGNGIYQSVEPEYL